MSSPNPKRKFLKEETGFTLPEMLITMLVMLVVLFALYNIFDASIRVFRFGNDKVEAVENARLGLEKMEREIRAAYPVVRGDSDKDYLFFTADGTDGSVTAPPKATMPLSAIQVTFGNDLGTGNGKIQCGSPCEYFTYKLTSTANASDACTTATAPCTLRRVNAANSGTGVGEPVVEFVKPGGLQFSYCAAVSDCPPATALTQERDIKAIRVELVVSKDGREQALRTDIDLRNRR